MARRRRTAALFEVINRSRPLANQKEPGVLSSVGSFFRGGPGDGEAAPISAVSALPPASRGPSAPSSDRPLDIDEDRQEVAFRISYTAAATVLFAIVTAVGAAYIAGRKTTPGVHSASKVNNVDPRLGPVQVDVTDLPRTAVKATTPAKPAVEPAPQARAGTNAPEAKQELAPASGNVVSGKTRRPGYQYVVIQSYPEQKIADEAKKALIQNGVDCTIEQNLPGWNGWFCVLGTTGFEKLANNPRYDQYLRKIRQISANYAKRGSFREFAPTPTRWDPNKRKAG